MAYPKSRIIEKKALDFRQSCGLNSRECISLESLLEELNVVTLFKPLSEGLSGMAIKVNSGNQETFRFILVNCNHTLGRQNFTICHELYHLFVQENFQFQTCLTAVFDKKDREEYNADLFASYLLMPYDGILSKIDDWAALETKDSINISTVLELEQYFLCSRAAIIFRLKEMGLISEDYAEKLKQNPKKSAIEYGFDIKLYEPGNSNRHLGDYGILAKSLFNQEIISESHYYELMFDLGVNLYENDKSGKDYFD